MVGDGISPEWNSMFFVPLWPHSFCLDCLSVLSFSWKIPCLFSISKVAVHLSRSPSHCKQLQLSSALLSFSSFWRKSVNTGRERGLNTSGTVIFLKKLRCTSFNTHFSTFSINSVRWHRIETFYKKCLSNRASEELFTYVRPWPFFLVVRRFTQKDQREEIRLWKLLYIAFWTVELNIYGLLLFY